MKTEKKRQIDKAIASFFMVGLGQILKGEGKKGLKLILFFYFALPSLVYVALMLNAYLFILALGIAIVAGFALWTYGIYDALTQQLLGTHETFI